MKFQPDHIQGSSITGYDSNWVAVNGQRYQSPVIVHYARGSFAWECGAFESLSAHSFEIFLDMAPEVLLFGSGARLRQPHPQWLQALYAKRIGVETMDTHGACRAYNFLMSEGRQVVAALLV